MRKRVGRYWEKLNFQAVIKSAASAASPEGFGRGKAGQALGLGPGRWPCWAHGNSSSKSVQGGCAGSGLDHGLKVVFFVDFSKSGKLEPQILHVGAESAYLDETTVRLIELDHKSFPGNAGQPTAVVSQSRLDRGLLFESWA